MRRIKKGDEIVVIAGKDKGRRGTVLRMLGNERMVVEGINMARKHMRPDPNRGVTGGIVEREMSIHASNVMLFNPISKKGERVGSRALEDGRKVRLFKSTGEVVDI